MHHFSVSWEITLLYFFSWNVYMIWTKKVLNCSREISPNLYFDRLLLLKVYKISAQELQRSYVSWHWRLMQNFVKWKEFREFQPEHSKGSKICTLDGSFCAKHLTFDLKKYRGVIFYDNKGWCKIWRKTDLWFGKPQSTQESQNWDSDSILLSKVENLWV